MDSTLDAIADYRGTIGATQNRLQSAITVNEIAVENLADVADTALFPSLKI